MSDEERNEDPDLVEEIADFNSKWAKGAVSSERTGGDRESIARVASWGWRAEEVARVSSIDGFEARRASGFQKIGGKHIAADGLVSRRGYRRILPAQDENGALWEERAEDLAQVAKEVLRGRNATVFEKHVLNPLFGRPKESCEALAKQFGCSVDRIYKINERNRQRVANAMRQRKEAAASLSRAADERERCPTCGFVYDNFGQGPECNLGYGCWADPKKIHPECARRFRPSPPG